MCMVGRRGKREKAGGEGKSCRGGVEISQGGVRRKEASAKLSYESGGES